MGRVREKRRLERKRKSHEKEDAGARNVKNVAKQCVFPTRSKSRLVKAAGVEPRGQMRNEKLRAVVARSTFASQNVKNMRV